MTSKVLFVTKDVTEVRTSDVEGVGTLRVVGKNTYRWVKYEGSTPLSPGSLVTHDPAGGEEFDHEVKVPATADLMFLAGVVMGEVPDSSSTPHYFWVQVLGTYSGVSILPHTQSPTGNWAVGQHVIGVNGQLYGDMGQTTQAAYSRSLQILSIPATHTTPTESVRSVPCTINCL